MQFAEENFAPRLARLSRFRGIDHRNSGAALRQRGQASRLPDRQ